jgi:hypothetical protein
VASLHTVYGTPWLSSSGEGSAPSMSNFTNDGDPTSKFVALELLFAAGILYALKKYGFRFNFGVSGR